MDAWIRFLNDAEPKLPSSPLSKPKTPLSRAGSSEKPTGLPTDSVRTNNPELPKMLFALPDLCVASVLSHLDGSTLASVAGHLGLRRTLDQKMAFLNALPESRAVDMLRLRAQVMADETASPVGNAKPRLDHRIEMLSLAVGLFGGEKRSRELAGTFRSISWTGSRQLQTFQAAANKFVGDDRATAALSVAVGTLEPSTRLPAFHRLLDQVESPEAQALIVRNMPIEQDSDFRQAMTEALRYRSRSPVQQALLSVLRAKQKNQLSGTEFVHGFAAIVEGTTDQSILKEAAADLPHFFQVHAGHGYYDHSRQSGIEQLQKRVFKHFSTHNLDPDCENALFAASKGSDFGLHNSRLQAMASELHDIPSLIRIINDMLTDGSRVDKSDFVEVFDGLLQTARNANPEDGDRLRCHMTKLFRDLHSYDSSAVDDLCKQLRQFVVDCKSPKPLAHLIAILHEVKYPEYLYNVALKIFDETSEPIVLARLLHASKIMSPDRADSMLTLTREHTQDVGIRRMLIEKIPSVQRQDFRNAEVRYLRESADPAPRDYLIDRLSSFQLGAATFYSEFRALAETSTTSDELKRLILHLPRSPVVEVCSAERDSALDVLDVCAAKSVALKSVALTRALKQMRPFYEPEGRPTLALTAQYYAKRLRTALALA